MLPIHAMLLSEVAFNRATGPVGINERRPLVANQDYFTISIKSARIHTERKFWARYHAAVKSYFTFGHLSGERIHVANLTLPSKLQEVDKKRLRNVIQLNDVVLGPVPYRGGKVEAEIGLIAVKCDDIGQQFVDFTTQIQKAGVGTFLDKAIPFFPLVKSGIDLILGTADAVELKLGITNDFNPPKTGTYAVIDARSDSLDMSKLSIDLDSGRLLIENKPFEETDYFIFEIEPSSERSNWYLIKQLSKAYNKILEAVSEGKLDDAEEAFQNFRFICLGCPELLQKDQISLVEKVRKELDEKRTALGLDTAKSIIAASKGKKIKMPEFVDLGLYK